MPLENLLTLVETLRARVDDHGDALRQNEMLTRYALIDPLLRELGWDTEDPEVVIPEYKPGKGSADYALLNDGKPVMILEAKKLYTPLQDMVEQGIKYCIMQGTNYLALTDGRRWEIYETHKPVPIYDKRVVAFDIKDQSTTEACLNALALWRPSVISNRVESCWPDMTIAEALALCRPNVISDRVQAGQTPVTGPIDEPPSTHQPTEETSVQSSPTENQPQPPDEQGWQPLSKLEPKSVEPNEILFPDKSTDAIRSWIDIMVKVVNWLIDKNILNESHCPIKAPGARTRYLVNTEPKHSNDKKFVNPGSIGCFHFQKHGVSSVTIRNVRHIIKHVGQDPAQFKVRFPDP